MPRKPVIEFVELTELLESIETWVSSLKPWAEGEDIFEAQDSEGRCTNPVHKECQIDSFLPSAKILCPNGEVTDKSYNAFINLKGGASTKHATLLRHSIKFRELSTTMRDCLVKFIDGRTVKKRTKLIIFCDYPMTYAITKWFLTCLDLDLAEESTLADYQSGKKSILLLSSRNIKAKLSGGRIICMDIVPTSVLYKMVDAVPGAHIKMLSLGKSHDMSLCDLYFEKPPTRGDRITCFWHPQTFKEMVQEDVDHVMAKGGRSSILWV